jgi:hypothetical protein
MAKRLMVIETLSRKLEAQAGTAAQQIATNGGCG